MTAENYKDLSKEELIKKIEKLESRKKYGLIWDEEKTKEKFEKDAENSLPVLKEIKGKEIKTDDESPINILIEGDNYHALSVLNFTHQNKIDVIYIDPPYNTGNQSWKYNNDYVEKEDTFKHSKWLSFMSKRFRLAKNLLSETGIICCTIDDYEVGTLILLMDEVFGENNRVGFLIVENNPRGRTTNNFFATCHEYYLVYAKNVLLANINHIPLTEEQKGNFKYKDDISFYRLLPFRRSGGLSTPKERPNSEFPIFYNKKTKKIIAVGGRRTKPFPAEYITDEIILINDNKIEKIDYKYFIKNNNKDVILIMPLDSSGKRRVWRWSEREKILEAVINGDFVVSEARNNHTIQLKDRIKAGRKPKTIWINPKYDASSNGTVLIDKILDKHKVFDYPKSLYAVKDFLGVVENNNKKSIFLDFFAGSGTTGHAVSLLNKEDFGKRQFILCTNNENGIAQDVCYPRIKNVINGHSSYKEITGIKSNLKYYKTAFVKNSISRDEMKIKITEQCTEMLCLREGIFEEVKNLKSYKIFKQSDKILAVYYSLEKDKLDSLKNSLDKLEGDKILYCFTLDYLGLERSDFVGWDDVRLEPIPQKILDVYKDIYEY